VVQCSFGAVSPLARRAVFGTEPLVRYPFLKELDLFFKFLDLPIQDAPILHAARAFDTPAYLASLQLQALDLSNLFALGVIHLTHLYASFSASRRGL
jgi:hypothetical protein